MLKILLIFAIFALLFTSYFAPKSQILASEGPENQNGSNTTIKPEDVSYVSSVIKTAKKVFKVFDWLENAFKKVWSWLLKSYYWIKNKMNQPVEQVFVLQDRLA